MNANAYTNGEVYRLLTSIIKNENPLFCPVNQPKTERDEPALSRYETQDLHRLTFQDDGHHYDLVGVAKWENDKFVSKWQGSGLENSFAYEMCQAEACLSLTDRLVPKNTDQLPKGWDSRLSKAQNTPLLETTDAACLKLIEGGPGNAKAVALLLSNGAITAKELKSRIGLIDGPEHQDAALKTLADVATQVKIEPLIKLGRYVKPQEIITGLRNEPPAMPI